MAITDAERHRLHTKLDQVLGEEEAAILISHLPPSGWSDVARTRDVDQLAVLLDERFARIDARFEATDARLAASEARVHASLERSLREQTHRFLAGVGGLLTLTTAAQTAIVQLLG
jgi:hypothetical protein